jgi:hypothetical protein
MRRGLPVRRSRIAWWSRLIGALALPVLAIAAFGARLGLVPGEAVLPLIVLGFALALLAFAFAAAALTDIWRSGAEAAGEAVAGLVYSLPVLLLLGLVVAASLVYPRLTDVSTDPNVPLALANPAAPEATPDEQRTALQLQAYPDLAPRFYALPIGHVYAAARDLIEDRGWALAGEAPPLSMPVAAPVGNLLAAADPGPDAEPFRGKRVVTQSRSGATRPAPQAASEPAAPAPLASETATLQAVAATPLFSFADDVVLRLEETPDGTRVDMRSASRLGAHDLGQNARRIRRFLADLDVALQPRPEAPTPAAPAEPEPVAPAEPEAPVSQ